MSEEIVSGVHSEEGLGFVWLGGHLKRGLAWADPWRHAWTWR